MKVLLVHNYYQLHGGESHMFEVERDALRSAGVELAIYTRHNAEIDRYNVARKASLPLTTLWARDTQRDLATLIARERPAIAHFTNTLPLISPAAYLTCQRLGVAVIQVIRNYRLACPAATFVRDGRVCEECPQHGLQRSVLHACYRGSRAASASVAAMLAVHRALGTFTSAVDSYVALTDFARRKLIETAGVPADRVVVKADFLHPDPGCRSGPGEYALYVGRLSPEKGLTTLLAAFSKLRVPLPLKILGEGPLEAQLRDEIRARNLDQVSLLGFKPHHETMHVLRGARVLIVPSEWYEGMPLSLLEAFASGVPVIASRLGALAELIDDGVTGLLFRAGDADALARTLERAWAEPDRLAQLSANARRSYEQRYTLEPGRRALLALYETTLERFRREHRTH